MKEASRIFFGFLKEKNLKETEQRKLVLEAFLKTERHLSTEDLYRLVRKKNPGVGYATVHRTLKLICESGLAREVDFGDGISRLEHKYGHRHHDHLICTKCGSFLEVLDPEIEKLQNKLAEKHDFYPISHKMDIFGVCANCQKG